MTFGRTIRIYLENGDITGIRHSEIVNWTGQGIFSPRIKVKDLESWDEAKRPGIYFLFGIDEKTEQQAVYIGESENILVRLYSHIKEKDFWNEVVFFTSKDDNLTKAHIKYLEAKSIELAQSAERYTLLNINNATITSLPRSDKDAMEEFIQNMRILLGTTGHKVLESLGVNKNIKSDKNLDKEFVLKTSNILAKAVLTNEGILVLKDSTVVKDSKDSLSRGYRKLRDDLIDRNIIIFDESQNAYRFSQDYLFASPSQAAAIIKGISTNGQRDWMYKNKTLKQIEEENITEEVI